MLTTTACLGLYDGARLLLGAHEQHRPTLGRGLTNEIAGLGEQHNGLLQVYYVNPIAGAEDERLHLRIPTAGLVPEVHPRLE